MPLRGIPLRGNPAAPALPPPHIPGPRRTGAVRVPGTLAGAAKGGEKGKSPLSLFPRPPLLPRGGRRRPGRPLRHFLPGDKGPAGTRAAPALFPSAAPRTLFPSAAPAGFFAPCRTARPFPPRRTCRPFFPRRTCREGPGAGGAGPARPHTPKPPACRAGAPAGLPPKKCGEAPLRARGGEPLFVLLTWLLLTAFLPARAPLLPAPGKSGPCGSRLPQRGAARARPAFPPCRRA